MKFDVIIAGGGLAGCLTALALQRRAPHLRILLVERAAELGGNHTWSFFKTDLTAVEYSAIMPLVQHSWSGYAVKFPGHTRELPTEYCSIPSSRLRDILTNALIGSVRCNAAIAELHADHVHLQSGERIEATCVIDARGPRKTQHLVLGFQKFLGQEVVLDAPHGQHRPIIMDASVKQIDGYRFVYTLPFAADRVLIEDTYYSDDAEQSETVLRKRIADYATSRNWTIQSVVREEVGILPIILGGDIEKHLAEEKTGAPRIGLAAGLFHPTTGYSLPDAVKVADLIGTTAAQGRLTTDNLRTILHTHIRKLWRKRAHFRMLNRFMFKAAEPKTRYVVLERFYRLNLGLVQRFYAGNLNTADKLRLVTGKPPMPILMALPYVIEASVKSG